MSVIPPRLISNENKVNLIKENYCKNCKLNRRTDIKQVLTPGGEIGADVWSSKDIFGLSVNIDLCNIVDLDLESFSNDVNITPSDKNLDANFISDEQLDDYDFDSIEVNVSENPIVYMIVHEISSIKGDYPYKRNTPEEKTYNYKLDVVFCPKVLNAFHFQIEVISDESGKLEKIERQTGNKKYIRSLASDIRARILEEKKISFLHL